MPDFKYALQVALGEALEAAEAITIEVFQHVPEKQEPPFHVIDKMTVTPIGGKDGGLDRIEVDVITEIRAPGREYLSPHMNAVRDTIDDQPLPVQAGVEFSIPRLIAEEDELLEDGQTYVGLQRFEVIAQPA